MTGAPSLPSGLSRLLVFNLATDVDDPVLAFTTDWLRALAANVGEIDVVTMRVGSLALPGNVQVHSVGKERGFSEPRRAAEFYRILRRLLSANGYDACFAHMMPLFAVMGAPLLRRRHIPITLWYTQGATPVMLRLAERLVDRVVTSNPDSFRLSSTKVHVIGHGIDTDLFSSRPCIANKHEPLAIVSAGRVSPVKQLDTLVRAVAQLPPDLLPVLRIIGPVLPRDEAYALRLHRVARDCGIEDRVEFFGHVDRPRLAAEYGRATTAVNLTPSGSFDKVALEAMSCGIPLVTSNSALGAIVSRVDKRLYVTADGIEPLVSALAIVLRIRPERRQQIGRRLRELVLDEHSLASLPDRLFATMPRRKATTGAGAKSELRAS